MTRIDEILTRNEMKRVIRSAKEALKTTSNSLEKRRKPRRQLLGS